MITSKVLIFFVQCFKLMVIIFLNSINYMEAYIKSVVIVECINTKLSI